jgi:hypothetical protein
MSTYQDGYKVGYFMGLICANLIDWDFNNWIELCVNDILHNRVAITLNKDIVHLIVSKYSEDIECKCVSEDVYTFTGNTNETICVNMKVKVIHSDYGDYLGILEGGRDDDDDDDDDDDE